VGLIERMYRAPGDRSETSSELSRVRVEGDLRALESLTASGRDLRAPLPLQFAIRLPSRKTASELAAPFRADGFSVEIEVTGDRHGSFDLYATRTLIVNEAALLDLSEAVDTAARDAGGTYRGWRVAPAAS
jgi:hypothetical protein